VEHGKEKRISDFRFQISDSRTAGTAWIAGTEGLKRLNGPGPGKLARKGVWRKRHTNTKDPTIKRRKSEFP
jgi:hypothetical protein